MADEPTVLDRWMRSLKNRPWIAAPLLLAAVVTGLASFSKGVNDIIGTFRTAPAPPQASAEDQRMQKEILGSWISTTPVEAPFPVHDFRFAYQQNGTFNWRGQYELQGAKLPILVSGRWRIAGGELTQEVTSSNVPLYVKEGFSNTTRIISVTAEEFVFINPETGKRTMAVRPK